MTADVEDRVATALHAWADTVHAVPTDPAPAIAHAQRRQRVRRTVVVAGGAAAALVAGILFVAPARHTVRTAGTPDSTPTSSSTDVTRWVLPDWATSYIHIERDNSYVEYHFANGDRSLQLSVYAAGTDRSQGEVTKSVAVRGTTGSLLDYGSGRYRIDWNEDGRVLEADGGPFATADAFIATVDEVQQAADAVWRQSLPKDVVLPDARPDAVAQLLDGVPLPAGLDRAGLDSGPAASTYDLAADVYGRVACAWIETWGAARTASDTTGMQAAAAALAGSHDWPGLAATTSHGAYAEVLWDLADRVVAGDATVLDGYRQALGC